MITVSMRPRSGWLGVLVSGAVAVVGAVASSGCGEDPAPGCRVARISDLPSTALTKLPDVRLDRAGAGFVLIGTDDKKDNVRFAALSETGELGPEATAAIPARTLGPWFAATSKAAPGDQLLIVYGIAGAASGSTALQIMTLDAGAAAPGAARPLLDSQGDAVVLTGTGVQVAMGTATSGKAAMIAWGPGTQASGPRILFLGADGASSPAGAATADGPVPWDCLAIVPSRSDFGISRVIRPTAPGGRPSWSFIEFKDDGSITYTLSVDSSTAEMGCPSVAPGSKGYTIAWQNTHGTYFSDVDTTRPMVFVASDIVRGAVRFGGPDRQPRVACVAAMGKDFGITYDTSTGPLVDRFSIFGNPRGGSLHLPSRGRPGPTSAWPRVDASFLTYLDRGADASTDVRKFASVDCPPEL
jgi:hypothetical protein